MAKDPQYGTPITPSEASLGLPFNPIYGVTPSNEYIPVQVDSNGVLSSNVIIEGVTVSLGMIKIQDGSGSFLATVDSTGHLYTLSVLADGTNTPYSASNPLRVDPTGTTPQPVTESGIWNITNISGTISLPTGAATESTLSDLDTNQSLTNLILGNGTQKTQIVDGSGNIIGSTSNSLNVDVTNTMSLPTGASTSANQTNASQKTQIVDGVGAVVGPIQTISGTNYVPVVLASSGTTGSAIPVRTLQVGGSDGTNLRSLKVSTTGVLSVDGSATTQPISGTVTANQGTSPWVVSGSVAQSSTTSGEMGNLVQGAVTTAAPTYVTGNTNPLSLTTTGNLRTQDVSDGPVTPGTAATTSQLIGGQFNSTAPTLTNTQQAALQLDAAGRLQTNSNAALPAAAKFGQGVIAVTGTAVQLASNALIYGVVITANATNIASIVVGVSGVTNTTNGTGNGYVLTPGSGISLAVANTNSIFINGTATDVVSFVGS